MEQRRGNCKRVSKKKYILVSKGKTIPKTPSEKKELIRFNSKMSELNDKGISYFIFAEYNGKPNAISNMDDWKLKALREFINNKAWELERKKLREE